MSHFLRCLLVLALCWGSGPSLIAAGNPSGRLGARRIESIRLHIAEPGTGPEKLSPEVWDVLRAIGVGTEGGGIRQAVPDALGNGVGGRGGGIRQAALATAHPEAKPAGSTPRPQVPHPGASPDTEASPVAQAQRLSEGQGNPDFRAVYDGESRKTEAGAPVEASGSGLAPASVLSPAWPRTFGVELEMIGPRRKIAQAVHAVVGGTLEPFIDPEDNSTTYLIHAQDGRTWKIENDYTLGVEESLQTEVVTPILFREDLPLLRKITKAAVAAGAEINDHCGIHVHLGANGTEVEHVDRLIDLLIDVEPVVIAGVFQTNKSRITRFARFLSPEFVSRFRASRPKTWEDLWELWYGKGYKPEWKKNRFHESRNHGANLHSLAYRNTVELRYFDASLDPDRIEQYARLALALGDTAGFPDSPKNKHLVPPNPFRLDAGSPVPTRRVWGFLSSFLTAQIVLEATALAFFLMTEPLTRGFTALAALAASSFLTYSLGSYWGGPVVSRLGTVSAYRRILWVRTAIAGLTASLFFLGSGVIPLFLMVGLFSLDYFFLAIGRVAEGKLQMDWFGSSPLDSNRYGNTVKILEHAAGFAIPVAAGFAIAKLGFGAVIYSAPLILAASALLSFLLPALPQAPSQDRPNQLKAALRFIRSDAKIRQALAGYTLINSFAYLFYFILATALGLFLTPGPAQAAQVSGSLISSYALGAGVGILAMTWINRRLRAKTTGLSPEQSAQKGRTLLILSASRWLKWAALGLLGAWTFSLGITLSSTMPLYWALPFIGMTAEIAFSHLDTLLKDHLPKEIESSILGVARAASYATVVLSFFAAGLLLDHLKSGTFLIVGVYATIVSAIYLLLSRSIARSPQAPR